MISYHNVSDREVLVKRIHLYCKSINQELMICELGVEGLHGGGYKLETGEKKGCLVR